MMKLVVMIALIAFLVLDDILTIKYEKEAN